MRDPHYEEILQELRAIWEPRKEYIDKDLWVIRNFLSQEEIDWIMNEANKPEAWYITMRSPYLNIANKYLDVVPRYDENGILVSQFDENPEHFEIPYFFGGRGINDRLTAVLPDEFIGTTTLQSFLAIREDNEEMKRKAEEWGAEERNVSFDWHFEQLANDDTKKQKLVASFSIYINDNFEGGELMFKNKPDLIIKPEPGMLVNIPITEEFTHKVSFVKGGDRHTLYGNCWTDKSTYPISTMENC